MKELEQVRNELEREISILHRRFSPKLEKAMRGVIVKL
jgi:hypothetical protein